MTAHWSLVAVFLAVVASLSGMPTQAKEKKGKSAEMTAAERDHLLKFINKERARRGLVELRLNAAMDQQAQTWAEHMRKTGKLQHGGFKGDRGQCIAAGQPTPEAVGQAWMGHAPHRDILMGKSFRELGVGRAGKFWVADFK